VLLRIPYHANQRKENAADQPMRCDDEPWTWTSDDATAICDD